MIKRKQYSSIFVILLLVLTVSSAVADDIVQYDPATDRITIEVKGISLTRLLGRIAAETGIAISIDPSIEKKISLKVNHLATEKALQKMGKELSYVLEFGEAVRGGKTLKNTVVAMKLLPKGMQDSGQLESVELINSRASHTGWSATDGIHDSGNVSPETMTDAEISGRPQSRSSPPPAPPARSPGEDMSEEELASQPSAPQPATPVTPNAPESRGSAASGDPRAPEESSASGSSSQVTQ